MLEPKAFYRSIESLLDPSARDGSQREFALRLLPRILDELGPSLGISGAQLFERRRAGLKSLGHSGATLGELPEELTSRLGADRGEGALELPWVGEVAGSVVGLMAVPEGGRLLIALAFRSDGGAPANWEQAAAMLSPLQYAITQHLRRRELEDLIEQARAIQVELLPDGPPSFGDYDIAATSIPAHVVGGDFYDFLALDSETLALTVADAAGHGLPAALQARDVATGLRMGVERDLKITRIMEKLNRVIHRSGLASRFISLVFAELELNGNLFYINAGHPAPLLIDDGGTHELAVGGMILGPDPQATYKMGFAHLDRGATLVVYTDGVIESGIQRGDAFGVPRLSEWAHDWRHGPAQAAVADLIERLRAHGQGGRFEDDVTVMLIRRPR